MTYLIRLERPVAIVSMPFAGSIGGGMVSYDDACELIKKNFVFNEDTILCLASPHLPTSEEKANNPFFRFFLILACL